jgi:hypothetical protein
MARVNQDTIHHPPYTILAYLDTNAHVVETVWVARTSEWSWLLLSLATIEDIDESKLDG